MKKEFIAHSENKNGVKHLLAEHLNCTAETARGFAPSSLLQQLFYLAGLLHDIGKFQENFQKYLEVGSPKTPHAGIGAYIASTLGKQFLPLQFVIKGHHAGLPDNEDRKSNNDAYSETKDEVGSVRKSYDTVVGDLENFCKTIPDTFPKERLLAECTTRFLFSALTDADWLDTERHFKPERFEARITTELKDENYDIFLNVLEKEFSQLSRDGKINSLRTKARDEVINHFNNPLGFFSLQLPTGLGKTLTSVYWAMRHAQVHKLKHIIIVLPYINIIDQTSLILKNIFGEDSVLEHHSGIIDDDRKYSDERYEKRQLSNQLACENWEAPIIITTAVQFFESLFSHSPFKCRKNHNIADSVVIFDEIQTLPKHLAEPTIIMLKNVASVAQVSFLFCTATMPAFGKRNNFDGIEAITPLIKNPKNYFEATKRVDYRLIKKLKPVSMDDVRENILKEKGSYLVIVNTKSIAKKIYFGIKGGKKHDHYYHLSTAMCPHHRKKIIREIITNLDPKQKKKIAVVSTQLVEAGLDFDFPTVYRAIAPLDAVIQAAGRCNRNGKIKKGKVFLFDLVDHKMPDTTYKSCAAFAKGIIQDDPNILHKSKSFEQYYEQVMALFVQSDKFGITEERKHFNFKTVDAQYRIIDTPTTPLFIDYADSEVFINELLEFFEKHNFTLKEHYRKIQQFGVQVYPDFLQKYDKQIESHKSGLRIWRGKYDLEVGMVPEDIETVF